MELANAAISACFIELLEQLVYCTTNCPSHNCGLEIVRPLNWLNLWYKTLVCHFLHLISLKSWPQISKLLLLVGGRL